MTADQRSLLNAVLADPADDTARLVYADWLEKHGEAERAAFVRVQCKLANSDAEIIPNDDGPLSSLIDLTNSARQAFQVRERELWASHSREWFVDERIGLSAALPDFKGPAGALLGIVSRGFVAEVRCTLAEWVGVPCVHCKGTGIRRNQSCVHCDGQEVVNAHGPRIVAEHPVERVDTEKRPQGAGDRWHWMREVDHADPSSNGLPWEIFDLLEGFTLHEGSFEDYPTEAAARSALSDALIAWARRVAGIELLEVKK